MTIQKKIKKYIKNKKGQGALLATIIGSIIMSTIIASSTQWFLSMNKTMGATNERLEAMTIAMSEWQRLEHMSLDELEDNRKNYKTPYAVGDKFKVGVTLGEQGYFDNGTCNSLTGSYASENANCFKDTIMTVYDKNGSALYTTRSLPLSVSRDSFPEGTILPYTGDLAKIPHGWVLCDGNNGTPDLTGRFLEGTKTTTGIFKAAGLPNITGMFNTEAQFGGVTGAGSTGGAFYTVSSGRSHIASDVDPGNSDLYFDASRVSAVYGKSDTVQPPAYTVFYIMKTNKDFHYNHTNGAPTPNIYTKEEVDALLKDLNNRVSNTYLPINSSKYVRNLTTQYTLGLGYNENDKTIHGYLGGTDTPFASPQDPDTQPYVLYSVKTSDRWARIYSDGWCEQGGRITDPTGDGVWTGAVYTAKMLVPFKDNDYMLFKSTLYTPDRRHVFGGHGSWVAEDGMLAQIDNQTVATWDDYAKYHDFYAIGNISQTTLDYYKILAKSKR